MIRHLNYLDVHPKARAVSAARARTQLLNTLGSVMLTPEQVAVVHKRLAELDLWEHGMMPEPTPQAPQQAPALPGAEPVARLPQHVSEGQE